MKTVGVRRSIYDLCRTLEMFEEDLNFSVFYPFAEILDSHLFCPGFYFDDVYYEVQYDEKNNLQVLDFGVKEWKEKGDEMTDAYINSLTYSIKERYEK